MTDETTSELLAEIDRDMADIERQVAELVEEAQRADYPQPEPVQVREGRWRTRGGDIRNVIPTPNYDERATKYPWYDAKYDQAWQNDGRYFLDEENHRDLVEYLGPIEADKTQELPKYTPPEGWRVVRFGELLLPGDEIVQIDDGRRYPTHRIGDAVGPNQQYIRRIKPQPQPQPEPDAATIEELRSEVSYVQRLLGEANRKVAQLEELVGSLRTINEAQEKAFTAAGRENTALKNQLAAVKAELASVAADRQQLRVELDAAQQVPADSPELRQLRADLAEVTLGRDTYRDGYERVLSDLKTIRETTKAAVVEAIAEWLQPIRAVDNPNLANETLQHLPQIMRHLTGLESND